MTHSLDVTIFDDFIVGSAFHAFFKLKNSV